MGINMAVNLFEIVSELIGNIELVGKAERL